MWILKLLFILWRGVFLYTGGGGNPVGIVKGHIMDSTNTFIEYAKVELNPLGWIYYTESDGKYFFDEIEPGQYELVVSKEGYIKKTLQVESKAGFTITKHFILYKEFRE